MIGPDNQPTEFNSRYKGGHRAARIDTQDKVAVIVAVEILASNVELVPPWSSLRRARIAFEAREDFEIRWDEGRQYVSVKDRIVSKSDLLRAIDNLRECSTEVTDPSDQSIRVEASSLHPSARSFYEDVERLRELEESSHEDYLLACDEFDREHNTPSSWATKLVVCERRIGENPRLAAAVFAHAIRSALPVHNFGDAQLALMFNDLSNHLLREKRRSRGALEIVDLETRLLEPLIPLRIANYQVAYTRTRYGYIRDRKKSKDLAYEQSLVLKFSRSLMREWRRHTRKDRWLNITVRGPIGCPACNHPLMANLLGWRGIACGRCGFQPYLTLFWACDCGSGAVVQRQPDLSALTLVQDAVRLKTTGDIVCIGCDMPPEDENFVGRLFTLPIPYPVETFSENDLIQLRISLGWHGKSWAPSHGADTSPEEVMLMGEVEPDSSGQK